MARCSVCETPQSPQHPLRHTLCQRSLFKCSTPCQTNTSHSEIIECLCGVGQGSPTSGTLFGFFLSDLPNDLREAGLSFSLFKLFIACLIFLDDIVIPLRSACDVQKALDTLCNYGKKWCARFSIPKTKVLCFNTPTPPETWRFGPSEVSTASQEKHLSVVFDSSGSWDPHYSLRLSKAEKALRYLQAAGLLGGKHPPLTSSLIAPLPHLGLWESRG